MAEEAYTEWRLTLTVASADLAQHQKQWLREAERWHTALALLDRTAPDQRDNVLQYRALERLFELYRQEPLTNTAQSMIYGLRLARSPETSSARAVEVYATIAQTGQWDWSQLEAEVTASRTIWPAAALRGWLAVSIDPAAQHSALTWLSHHPGPLVGLADGRDGGRNGGREAHQSGDGTIASVSVAVGHGGPAL